jgi:hypothetical protein
MADDDLDAAPTLDAITQYSAKARELFEEIERHFGRGAARRIFNWCIMRHGEAPESSKPLDPKKAEVVDLLHAMEPLSNRDVSLFRAFAEMKRAAIEERKRAARNKLKK